MRFVTKKTVKMKDDMALFEIETDEEWEMVEEMLATFSEEEDTE